MLNSTKFELPETKLGNLQTLAIILIWLLIEVLGNALLIGLIQYERLGGDPLKRRIIDQVYTYIRKISSNQTNLYEIDTYTQFALLTKFSVKSTGKL